MDWEDAIRDENASDLLDRLDNLKIGDGLKEDDIVEYKEKREGFQRCCAELARRAWVVYAVEDDYEGLGQIHRCVMRVIEMAEDGSVKLLDQALYDLALALGMPACEDSNPGRLRMMAMHHIVSSIQCGVMMMSTRESNGGGGLLSPMEGFDEESADVSDNILQLGSAIGMGSNEKNAVEILRGVVAEMEKIRGKLPPGFFDVMVKSEGAKSWNDAQVNMLQTISDQLNAETRLRRSMMVDRALATLKSFSSSQLVQQNPGLMIVLDSKTQEALKIMEMICQGSIAGVDDAFRMTKGEIVSLLMESKHEGAQDARVKTVRIGHVPDRGGRPEGQSRAAGLMPEWQERKKGSAGPGHGKKKHNKNHRKNTAGKA